jgi:serine protease Do
LLLGLADRVSAQNRVHTPAALAQLSDSLHDITKSISPSVVQITGTGYGLTDRRQQSGVSVVARERNIGSGLLVTEDGYIVTNAHVVQGSRAIRVKLNGRGGQTFDARLVGSDSVLDLAVLQIQAAGLTALPLGDRVDVKQGQIVLAFGSPLGMDNSVSLGVVSSNSRQLSEDDPRTFIQTDAPINPGNSGGPLVDVNGRVVGINTFIFTQSGGSEGVGFAIPVNIVKYGYAALRKDGRIHRGQIGIFARTITTPIASALKLEPGVGVLVEDVIPEGPADRAGIRVNDVVVSVAGMPLHNVRELAMELLNHAIGTNIDVQIFRDGKPLQVVVPVVEKDNALPDFASMVNPDRDLIPRLQILAVTVNDEIRGIGHLREQDGVLVAAFVGAVPYFGDQLHQGDIIHAVNGRPVATVETLRSTLDKIEVSQPLVLQVERDGMFNFVVLEPN